MNDHGRGTLPESRAPRLPASVPGIAPSASGHAMLDSSRPRLSVIVAFHDMAREAPRTLHTLSPRYQRGVNPADYEVLAVDCGSEPPLPDTVVHHCGPNCRLVRMEAAPSPAASINAAVRLSRGEAVMLCIDGARMLTPGIVRLTLAALRAFPDPVVATLAWHLGPKLQNESLLEGYCQTVEDRLLDSVDWKRDGYELFRIASLAGSSAGGWFLPAGESNCLAVRRSSWDRLGGLDERFVTPGGGFVNLDFYRRACTTLEPLVRLLGEGSFHQFHGGVASNASPASHPFPVFHDEYVRLRGEAYEAPAVTPVVLGSLPPQAAHFLTHSLDRLRGAAP